jgi:Domain of unknown function (DUF1772)
MDYTTFGILTLTGFTACAEFGSYAFVHPVLRNLPPKYHIQVERGFLRTFGRVMPVLMTLCVIAPIAYALHYSGTNEPVKFTRWIAAAFFTAALTFTAIFNVPINLATGKWDPDDPPKNWKQIRNKWERFQGIRSWFLLLGFIAICVAVSVENYECQQVRLIGHRQRGASDVAKRSSF